MTKQILTIISLLFSLFTYTVAQNRAPREALEGLRDIGVVVKYGRVDGLDEATPIVLQRLQTRAEDTLSEAGVPVLKRTNEADMVNRPRLVLTITVNQPTDTAPTILVESRLYERVRLLRDTSKERELATWVLGGVGISPRATEEMMFQLFDGQLNYFIREYRGVNPTPPQPVVASPKPPTDVKDNANSLEGVNAIGVYVTFSLLMRGPSFGPEQAGAASRRAELQKELQEEAKCKLVLAGIPVPKYWSKPDRLPLLYMRIILGNRPTARSYAPPITVESEFWQEVRHLRDLSKQTLAVTWESGASDGGPITDDAVRKVMNNQLDEFIKAYKAANPQLASVPNGNAQ